MHTATHTSNATVTQLRPLLWGSYTRISEDPNDLRRGVNRQRDDNDDAIIARGGTPPPRDSAHEHVENDTSAWKRRKVTITDHYGETRTAWRVVRPKWAKALHDLRSGTINALMVNDLDRLARDPYDLEDAIEAVQHYGATIVSATASTIDLMTTEGQLSARLAVMIANKSSADTARRVTRAHLENARQGVPVGGVRPFGFNDDKITHRADEAALLRKAALDVIDGVPLRTIASEWQAAGIKSPRDRVWRSTTIRQMLKGPRLAGLRVYRGEIMRDTNGEPVRGQWEPIIDVETWEKVQAVLTRPETRRRIPRKGARHYLLSGIVRCGICHEVMYGNGYASTNGQPRHYYVCQGSADARHVNSVSGHGVDALIVDLMTARLATQTVDPAAATFDGQERLDAVRRKIGELMEQYNSEQLPGDIVFPQVGKLSRERDELEEAAKRFDGLALAAAGSDGQPMTVEKWEVASVDRRRAVVEQHLSAVYIKPAKQRQNKLDPTRVDPVWKR